MFKLCLYWHNIKLFLFDTNIYPCRSKNKKNYPVILFGQFKPLQPLENLLATSFLYHWSGVLAKAFLLLLEGVYLNGVPVPNKPPPGEPPPPPPPPIDGGGEEDGAEDGVADPAAGGGDAASFNQFLKLKVMNLYMFMSIQFKKWLLKTEMAGSYAIVSCRDRNNPNFQVWGAMSDLGCNKKKKRKKNK
jgi:hypothetical protein